MAKLKHATNTETHTIRPIYKGSTLNTRPDCVMAKKDRGEMDAIIVLHSLLYRSRGPAPRRNHLRTGPIEYYRTCQSAAPFEGHKDTIDRELSPKKGEFEDNTHQTQAIRTRWITAQVCAKGVSEHRGVCILYMWHVKRCVILRSIYSNGVLWEWVITGFDITSSEIRIWTMLPMCYGLK